MKMLKTHMHPSIKSLKGQTILKRWAARAIVLKKDKILLLHTKRYSDYSLPGGGLEPGEDKVTGLIRELQEETGAQNIHNIQEFGQYEEFRPWYKPEHDILHMLSYCYTCDIGDELGPTKYEDYEVKNGMQPVWVNIFEAIQYNQNTIKENTNSGLSIERETFLLKLIAQEKL